ncbi:MULTISPECIES: hypothetical protein [unclassified Wolbachia]|uniref:hypothetical protein n=2 Tax=Wolbachia TaxID=953 RepID=UPI00333E5C39
MLEKIRQNIFGHFKYLPAETEERAMLCDLTNFKSSNDQLTRIDQVLNRDQLEHFTNVLETYDATARSFYDEVHCKIATVATMNSKIFKEPTSIFKVNVHVIPQIISVF